MSIGVSLYFGCITALIVVSVFAIRPPKWVYKEYKLAFGYPYFVSIIVACMCKEFNYWYVVRR